MWIIWTFCIYQLTNNFCQVTWNHFINSNLSFDLIWNIFSSFKFIFIQMFFQLFFWMINLWTYENLQFFSVSLEEDESWCYLKLFLRRRSFSLFYKNIWKKRKLRIKTFEHFHKLLYIDILTINCIYSTYTVSNHSVYAFRSLYPCKHITTSICIRSITTHSNQI